MNTKTVNVTKYPLPKAHTCYDKYSMDEIMYGSIYHISDW